MSESKDVLTIVADTETDNLVNFIFRELPDNVVDMIDLERLSPATTGVARELVTLAAVLTFSSTLSIAIFRLVERWMEQERQRVAAELIYKSGTDNPTVTKILSDLEKKHSDVLVRYGSLKLPDRHG